ncbi:MAG: hypothetical protein A2Z77_03475 [Chloroflexi bacterium RBG_13_51_36]|nr:MAG: hypothetical protein A2Z77_03475 [Chloroflexi bacterium RBG_13_51_36]
MGYEQRLIESRLAKTNGKPAKRIVRDLRAKCAGGNRPTYEKELLNSRKNNRFPKTNHPAFPYAPPLDTLHVFASPDAIGAKQSPRGAVRLRPRLPQKGSPQ